MLYDVFSSFLKQTEPEFAHQLAINLLKKKIIPFDLFAYKGHTSLNVKVFDLNFENPVGLAAGFDKNAEVYNSLYKLGFGFVEVGTITPLPQYGNPKPRVFRLVEDEALINRLGFNNKGSKNVYERIANNSSSKILGINIGPNKENATKNDDYIKCLKKFHDKSDYITINITYIIKAIQEEIKNFTKKKSILFKLSPNIEVEDVDNLSKIFLDHSVDGLILTNTSISGKEQLKNFQKSESGGLSGSPIYEKSNIIISEFYKRLRGKIPIIGAGGVSDGETAYEKIKSGASLLQLYTSLVFKGPYVASTINEELVELLKQDGFSNISQAVGINTNQ